MFLTTKSACDAWPVHRQTYGYLPSFSASLPFHYNSKLYCLMTKAGVPKAVFNSTVGETQTHDLSIVHLMLCNLTIVLHIMAR